jgi:hypothetical protein
MLWINTGFGRRDTSASHMRVGRIFAAGAAVIADLPAPAFAADLTAPPPAFTWTGLYIGANIGAWFAPANPSYEANGFRSAGVGLVLNGG